MTAAHADKLAYTRMALLAGIASFVVILYWPSYATISALWDTSDHRHGILVFPIAAFLAWRMRFEVAAQPMAADYRGLLLVLPVALVWLLARLTGIQVVEHFAALAMIPAVIVTFLGTRIARKLLFPFVFLLFATPVSDALIPHLMIVTADISAALLKLSGIPVLRNGQYMSLPGGNFVVADVCSGARYLLTGVMVAALYAYLTYDSLVKRLALVAVTGIALVVTNGVRAYVVMAVASATNMQYLGGRDHIYFGWLLFGIVMLLIMWVGTRYADQEEVPAEREHGESVSGLAKSAVPLISALALIMLAVTVKPLQADFGATGALLVVAVALLVFVYFVARRTHHLDVHRSDAVPRSARHDWKEGLTIVATLFVLIGTPQYLAAVEREAVTGSADATVDAAPGCRAGGQWGAPWRPEFGRADATFEATFACAGGPVGVYVAAYTGTRQGGELISSENAPIPQSWDRVSDIRRVPLGGENGASINEIQIDARSYQALVWYWYEVDGEVSATGAGTKLRQLLALLRGRPAGGRVVVLETPTGTGDEAAQDRLTQVADAIRGTAKQ